MNKKLLQSSIDNTRFEAAKKKAVLEEIGWYHYMPETPKFIPQRVEKHRRAWGLLKALEQLKP